MCGDLRWLSGLAAVFREFRRRADLDHEAPNEKGQARKPQPEAKRRDRVSTWRSASLAERSGSGTRRRRQAAELTEDGEMPGPRPCPHTSAARLSVLSPGPSGLQLGRRPPVSRTTARAQTDKANWGTRPGRPCVFSLLSFPPAPDGRPQARVRGRTVALLAMPPLT